MRFLNTVIGKMSGVITGADELQMRKLATITPDNPRAFLVEAFNRILISQVKFPASDSEPRFERGITAFCEKSDLLPFEEAKLYGHNATHALAAYLAFVPDLKCIAELRQILNRMEFIREAFLEESGEALIRKYRGIDRLFTPDGYREYAEDLLERMTNQYLQDTVERVGRDPERKLGWDDRLVGTVRLALRQHLVARRYALGAAAALARLEPAYLKTSLASRDLLVTIWGAEVMATPEAPVVLDLIDKAKLQLQRWCDSGLSILN